MSLRGKGKKGKRQEEKGKKEQKEKLRRANHVRVKRTVTFVEQKAAGSKDAGGSGAAQYSLRADTMDSVGSMTVVCAGAMKV